MELHSSIIGETSAEKHLIILHGFLGMGDNWKSFAKKFNDKFNHTVHLVDQRNHGRSPHSENFNYELLASDVKSYIEKFQLENISILGHSMGGKTAMTYACNYPDTINSIIIADIAPKQYPAHHQQILTGLLALQSTELNSRQQADQLLSSFIPELGIRMFLLKNLFWKEKGKLSLRCHVEKLQYCQNEIGKPLDKESYFEKQALFLRGTNSDYIQLEDHKDIQKYFPKSTIVDIPKAGHWLHVENPIDFFEAVSNFMKKL